jgi:ribosome-associated protein
MTSNELATKISEILSNKKGEDIVIIDISNKSIIADYYVIATGRSTPHVRTLAENLEEELDKIPLAPLRREGIRDGRWAVLDYGDVVVHIFNDESRLFYHLERLWSDGDNTRKIED